AGDRDVAEVAPAVDEGGAGEYRGQEPEVHVIVGHLIGDPVDAVAGEAPELLEVLVSQAAEGRPVEVGHALDGRAGAGEDAGEGLEGLAGDPNLRRAP